MCFTILIIETDDVHFGKCLITFSLQYSRSPLHLAAERGHTDVVNIFIKHGANLDIKDWVIDICIYALCFKLYIHDY